MKLKPEGDQAIIHGQHGRSNRKIEEETRQKAVEILRRDGHRGELGRGRDGHRGPPPARIRTSGTTAYGSYLGYLASKRTLG